MLRAGARTLEERLREHGSAHTRAGLWGAGRSPQHPPWVISVHGALSGRRDRHHTKPRGLPDSHSEQCFQGCIPSTPCICPRPPHSFPALHTTRACTLALCCLESFPQTQELPELVLKCSGKVTLDPRAGHLPSPVVKQSGQAQAITTFAPSLNVFYIQHLPGQTTNPH